VVNPCFEKDLENLGIPSEKITYIPNYVSHEEFKILDNETIDKIKDKYNVPKDKFVVLGCGQIQTRKGIDDLLTQRLKIQKCSLFGLEDSLSAESCMDIENIRNYLKIYLKIWYIFQL
jgi:hypothetical protein